MPKIKICHLTTSDLTLRYILLNQIKDLQAHDYDVTTISSSGDNIAFLKQQGIRHISVEISRSLTPFKDLVSLFRLYQTMRKEKFDLVHTHTPKAGLLGQIAAAMAGVPIVVNTIHGFYFHENMSLLKRRFYIAIEKFAAQFSSLIFFVNEEDIRTAKRNKIGSTNKLKLLGSGGVGIDINHFNPERISPQISAMKRAELGLNQDDFVLGFVGRLVREKGILELLEAMSRIQAQIPNLRALIIGPVDKEKADAVTAQIAQQYGIESKCIFLGLRNDIAELMSLMKLFVLPSHREGFPVSPMEAAAMSLPVIVTNVRGCRDVVEDNITGYVIPLQDIDALATAILKIYRNPEAAQRMGLAGRKMAQARFDEQIPFEKLRNEYSRLLENKSLISEELS